MRLLDFPDYEFLKAAHNKLVETALTERNKKKIIWTRSIAVGDEQFIKKAKILLGNRAKGRKRIKSETGFELREDQAPYEDFDPFDLDFNNKFYWDI